MTKEPRRQPTEQQFRIEAGDVGRYVRRISTGLVGPVRRDKNGWLYPDVGGCYEWAGPRRDLEYVTVTRDLDHGR